MPPYPEPSKRDDLFSLSERFTTSAGPRFRNPQWLDDSREGLYTGTAIVGAIGTGKTSCCMYPFADRSSRIRHRDRGKRIGRLVLEVKGDFCHKVQEILQRQSRAEDYIEIGLDSEYRYNPLHNDLDAYALAYNIASLLNNLFGEARNPSGSRPTRT